MRPSKLLLPFSEFYSPFLLNHIIPFCPKRGPIESRVMLFQTGTLSLRVRRTVLYLPGAYVFEFKILHLYLLTVSRCIARLFHKTREIFRSGPCFGEMLGAMSFLPSFLYEDHLFFLKPDLWGGFLAGFSFVEFLLL